MSISPARVAAFEVLLEIERRGGHADELLHERARPLGESDRRLATEITMGVLRWRCAIDDPLRQQLAKPLDRLEAEVLTSLRMAAYQIGWLDRVPASAAVNDSVGLVKRARKTSAAGLVNAVLRKVAAMAGGQLRPAGARDASPAELARAYAHPEWMVARWSGAFGAEAARAICAWDQQAAPTGVRVRDADAAAGLLREGVELAPGALLRSARRVVRGDVARTEAFKAGQVQIQDEGSQLVALLVGRGKRILDCCAAPGGKTLVIADRNPRSHMVATDVSEKRAAALRERVPGRVEVVTGDARALPEGRFDRVLADVPCSGTGTLARNPEIKWRLQPEELARYQRQQVEILSSAVDHLERGGRLIYATCSLEREEGEEVAGAVMGARRDVRVVAMRDLMEELRAEGELVYDFDSLLRGAFLRTLPGIHGCDGFFAAALERR